MRITLFFFIAFSGCWISCKKEPPAPLPFADFLVNNNGCVAPCKLYFYDNSLNAVKWEWNFGNGFNSFSKNDSNQYNLQGFYDVFLKVWNSDDVADSVIKTIYVY